MIVVARALGYEVEDTTDYKRIPNPELLVAETSRQLVKVDTIKPGSVLLIHFSERDNPYHYAIATSPTYMIHGDALKRKVVEHGITDGWEDRIHSIFDFPGVVD